MKDITAIAPLYGSVVPGVPSLRHCSGVLFDFNGTLSDDEGILRRLFIGLAQGAGLGRRQTGTNRKWPAAVTAKLPK